MFWSQSLVHKAFKRYQHPSLQANTTLLPDIHSAILDMVYINVGSDGADEGAAGGEGPAGPGMMIIRLTIIILTLIMLGEVVEEEHPYKL